MSLKFSFVIPVYNRPEEIRELFESLVNQKFDKAYEVVLVEDDVARSIGDRRITQSQWMNENFCQRQCEGNDLELASAHCLKEGSNGFQIGIVHQRRVG